MLSLSQHREAGYAAILKHVQDDMFRNSLRLVHPIHPLTVASHTVLLPGYTFDVLRVTGMLNVLFDLLDLGPQLLVLNFEMGRFSVPRSTVKYAVTVEEEDPKQEENSRCQHKLARSAPIQTQPIRNPHLTIPLTGCTSK